MARTKRTFHLIKPPTSQPSRASLPFSPTPSQIPESSSPVPAPSSSISEPTSFAPAPSSIPKPTSSPLTHEDRPRKRIKVTKKHPAYIKEPILPVLDFSNRIQALSWPICKAIIVGDLTGPLKQGRETD
ncbi:uncharacterized protein LOC131254976 [Magnolia sinica]|uniref:uncharacterized protein LOC131254976 n=1 Tax=Magnolia sinica TaxID=86752 RepID=UPI002659B40A|nr:uncharacterized protein LOC131254976 [Magnolia sinica]